MSKRGDPRVNRAYRYKFRNTVLSRDNFICFYCGADADQVDHVIPVSKAPELVLSFDNAVACCKRCNVQKGNKSQGVFLAKTATALSKLSTSSGALLTGMTWSTWSASPEQ